MPYRPPPEDDDYRARPRPIDAPPLPKTAPRVEAPAGLGLLWRLSYWRLSRALEGARDPTGGEAPVWIRLAPPDAAGCITAEVELPEAPPGAPRRFVIKLSAPDEPARRRLRLAAARIRRGWLEHFAALERARIERRAARLAEDAAAQAALTGGHVTRCPRCDAFAYARTRRAPRPDPALPVLWRIDSDRCGACSFSREAGAPVCPACGGQAYQEERAARATSEEDEEAPLREIARWRCRRCAFAAASTRLRAREPE
jgi:hypothetical protein